jgi:hypothetical protein
MANRMNIDESKSYATEENLMKALQKLKLDTFDYLVVRNKEGRFTAIFPLGWNREAQPIWFASNGFMVVG